MPVMLWSEGVTSSVGLGIVWSVSECGSPLGEGRNDLHVILSRSDLFTMALRHDYCKRRRVTNKKLLEKELVSIKD